MPHEHRPGEVLLVGAGPGPADLMTVRAMRAVEGAEALLYDALVHEEVLALAPRACVRIQTGKRAGRTSMSQDTINRLMLRLARRGLKVVRLKGGDPSVFGRSGEERAFLEGNGVAVAIVPGVTAASAAAAQFAFPLTHRGVARRVIFATARVQDGTVVEEGWSAKADPSATLALYMGRDACAAVANRLIEQGRSPATPAVAVENAGSDDARLISADLARLPELVAQAACTGPVLIVIGEAVAMARPLAAAVAERRRDRRSGLAPALASGGRRAPRLERRFRRGFEAAPLDLPPDALVDVVEGNFRQGFARGDRHCVLGVAGDDQAEDEGVDAADQPPSDRLGERPQPRVRRPLEQSP